MTTRTNTCQWCGIISPTPTDHMLHIHDEHPDTIGRGRTMSKAWACPDCGHDNPPVINTCTNCGRTNQAVADTNATRRFVVARRRPDGTISRTRPILHTTATASIAALPAVMTAIAGGDRTALTTDLLRHEVWHTLPDGRTRRVAWLEVADVTATPNYDPKDPR